MRIERLTLQNFKCFESREFEFNPHFNLLVGDNASGKSSVLDALAVSIGSWFLGIRGYQKSPGIDADDVRVVAHRHGDSFTFEKRFPVRIECSGIVLGERISWVRELQREGGRTTSADARSINDAAIEAERQVRAGEGVTLPLICSYSTERLWYEQGHRQPNAGANGMAHKPSRLDGYRDCFNFTIQETDLIDWIRDQATVSPQLGHDPVALAVVKAAMKSCVEGAQSIYYDGRYKDLVVEIGQDGPQLLRNLSDGQRIMLTLVGDLAKRAATLNPHLGNAALRDTPGVVLIDELDLHLHPKWQRRVIRDLKTTFPSIQFITTTHSPQLIGEARAEEIRVLDRDGTTTPARSFGIDSSRALEEVMGAESRNHSVGELLSRLSKAIDDEDFGLGASLAAKLEEMVGPDDPEVTRARALMSFLESEA
jgi:predicted ATP-binding protein involved in virulence